LFDARYNEYEEPSDEEPQITEPNDNSESDEESEPEEDNPGIQVRNKFDLLDLS